MAELLLKIGDINSGIQTPAAEAVPEKVRCNPLPLPHFARPRLLESCILCGLVQESLDLPGGDMPLISALEDVAALPALKMDLKGLQNRLENDRGALLAALAVHHMQVSSGAVHMICFQGGHLRDAKTATGHQPHEGGLSWGGGGGK